MSRIPRQGRQPPAVQAEGDQGPVTHPPRPARREKTVRFASTFWQAGFTMVPNIVLLDGELSPMAVRLYGLLAYYAREDESAYPGDAEMTAKCGGAERTLRNAKRELERAGFLQTIRRGNGKTNLYVLTDPTATGVSPQPSSDRQYLPITRESPADRQDLPFSAAASADQERQDLPVLKDYADAVEEGSRKKTPSPQQVGGSTPEPSPGGRSRGLRSTGTSPRQLAALARHQQQLDEAAANLRPFGEQHEIAWQRMRQLIEGAVNESSWGIWLERVHLAAVDVDGHLVLDAPDDVRTWVRGRFARVLAAAAGHVDVPARLATDIESQLLSSTSLTKEHHDPDPEPGDGL